MKNFALRTLLFFNCLFLFTSAMCQPAGTQYVIQPDFGDQQGNGYPTASMQWTFLQNWNNVNALGQQTNWCGPGYAPYGQSQSHPYYVVLDDVGDDYGAVAGRISNLEYRLVQCNFSYRVFNQVDLERRSTVGDLYVLLGDEELDFPAFDPSDPQAFETDGHGQVLFHFVIPPTFPDTVGATWLTLAGTVQNDRQRQAYVLNSSTNGVVGSPFTYVGLIWVSEFAESRIMIDNFTLTDICPDCQLRDVNRFSGCFANSWATPIPNNYYYYSAEIREVGTNNLIFSEIHRPSTFLWDGLGNQPGYNGVLTPENVELSANITYYSCLRQNSNVPSFQFLVRREANCIDSAFGSLKRSNEQNQVKIYPNPVEELGFLYLAAPSFAGEEYLVVFRDFDGRQLASPNMVRLDSNGKARLSTERMNPGIYFVEIVRDSTILYKKIILK